MDWQVTLGIEDLTAARFAISPLYETVRALDLLRSEARTPIALASWVRWARDEIDRHPIATPLVDGLLFDGRPTYPEFLTPAPTSLWTGIDDELETVLRTPHASVRGSVERVWSNAGPGNPVPRAARALADDPDTILDTVATEFRTAFDVLVAPFWPRIRSMLEADIAYKARRIAQGGFDAVFGDLRPAATWDGRTLRVGSASGRRVRLGIGGLVLTPSVLGWPDLTIKFSTSSRTALRYPARGAGTLFAEQRRSDSEGLARLIGAGRARVLRQLITPATPTGVAAALGVTPSAVTQHLRVLRDGSLVRSERGGRSVLYSLTEIGAALLTAAPDEESLFQDRVRLHDELGE